MGVSCRNLVPPEKACPVGQAFSLSVGRCPTPCQGCVFEKAPLGTLKNFFKCVKAKPSPLWVFCAFVHGGRHRRKPLGFRRCLPPARPEKAKPFQAGRSPCTKHPQTVRLRLYALKKVFEGSKGRFYKNAPWQGVGQRSTKRGRASPSERAFSGGIRSFHETPTDRPASPLRT